MFRKIKSFIRYIKYLMSYECCYKAMEREGYATFGNCRGLSGGDKQSCYMSYTCLGCPYLCPVDSSEERRKKALERAGRKNG